MTPSEVKGSPISRLGLNEARDTAFRALHGSPTTSECAVFAGTLTLKDRRVANVVVWLYVDDQRTRECNELDPKARKSAAGTQECNELDPKAAPVPPPPEMPAKGGFLAKL